MTPIIKIHRHDQDENQSSGIMSVFDNNFPLFASLSLERGWKNNENDVSCLPIGEYDVVLEYSPKYGKKLWEIKGTGHRSECKFHAANYWTQLNGCIAPGLRYLKMNNDNYRDVTNSGNSLTAFMATLKPATKARLIITGNPGIF